MARLHEEKDSDDELPELSAVIGLHRKTDQELHSSTTTFGQEQRKIAAGRFDKNQIVSLTVLAKEGLATASHDEKQVKKQRPLKIAHVNTLLLPISSGPTETTKSVQKTSDDSDSEEPVRPTPRRVAKQQIDYSAFTSALSTALGSDDDQSLDDLSAFIVRDSDSELDVKSSDSPRTYVRRSPKKLSHAPKSTHGSTNIASQSEVIDLISPDKTGRVIGYRESRTRGHHAPTDTQEKRVSTTEELPATLRLSADPSLHLFITLTSISSPSRLRSPTKKQEGVRFITPPGSPSKPRLQSPSKQHRIPQSPHRPSIDAFWSQEVINDWNDQYSPKKTPKSERGKRLFPVGEDEESDFSPTGSPPKSPQKTPHKKGKADAAKRKDFNAQKHDLATAFLQELDQRVANGQVASMASSAGGIHIIWSKKLNSTAGRANWKRETLRTKSADGTVTSTSYRHHASIELAEKVIDDE
ncbi:MAG: hypothetical protein LQ347_005363, partial [Umbilicaria vellea]